ncbi:WD40-repeat-containing domain protein [Mycena galopus ATCC 62051]|nr:WD40-repeat-containing domain protein [Mycena galopus ATCC 62051]
MPPSRPDYTRQRGLENHPGTILALALTADGKTLVTGGSAGTRAWDAKRLSMMARPATAGVRGATTVLLCVRRVDEPVDVIYSGTANGYIFCWRNRKGKWEETFAFQIDEPKDITGIAFDASTNRLIICSSGGRVVAWGAIRDESNRVHMSKVFSRKIEDFEPRAITFAGFDSSKDKDILLFGENHTGPIYKLRGKTGEVIEEWTVGSPIGDAQVDWKEGVVLFDDIFTGPSLWRYHDYTQVKMYFISATRDYGRIRNVRFAEGATAVVCGSDHGLVYIFNLQMGERLQRLDTETGEWVQTVATAEVDGVSTVFAAPTRSEDGDVELCVWKRLEPELEATPSTFWKTIWLYLIRIIVACCCIGFLVQNLQGLLGTTVGGAANITAEAQEVGKEILGPVLNGEL